MRRTLFVVFAAVITLLIGAALPNFGTAHASSVLTPSAERTAVVVLAGSADVAPVATEIRDGFVRETNPSQATQVLTKLGTTALWTYNPVLREFQPLATTMPKVGSAIYVRPTVGATLQTLSDPSWAAAITASPKGEAPATYDKATSDKARQHPALGRPAFKVSKHAKPNQVRSSSAGEHLETTPKEAPIVQKTTTVAAAAKPAVGVSTKKTETTNTDTTVKKTATTVVTTTPAKTTSTPAKTTTTPVRKKRTTTTTPVTQTTVPSSTTVPPTTVAPTPTSVGGTMAAPAGYTASQLVFNDSASGTSINSSNWNTFITSNAAQGQPWNSNGAGGSTPAGSSPDYNAEYDLPGQVSEGNGVIDIRATETPTNGMLDGTPTVFPWASGALSSYGHFQFDGGYVQIEAKMPSGSGMWPGLWMLPGPGGTSGDNYEIDIFEGGANDGGPGTNLTTMYAWHLHTPSGTVGADTNTNVNLTTGFNTYGLKWVPGQSITWYLNGNVVGSVTSAQASIPNEPMELIMNLQVATAAASAWHSVYNSSTPTVNDMLISDVQVYS